MVLTMKVKYSANWPQLLEWYEWKYIFELNSPTNVYINIQRKSTGSENFKYILVYNIFSFKPLINLMMCSFYNTSLFSPNVLAS